MLYVTKYGSYIANMHEIVYSVFKQFLGCQPLMLCRGEGHEKDSCLRAPWPLAMPLILAELTQVYKANANIGYLQLRRSNKQKTDQNIDCVTTFAIVDNTINAIMYDMMTIIWNEYYYGPWWTWICNDICIVCPGCRSPRFTVAILQRKQIKLC